MMSRCGGASLLLFQPVSEGASHGHSREDHIMGPVTATVSAVPEALEALQRPSANDGPLGVHLVSRSSTPGDRVNGETLSKQ